MHIKELNFRPVGGLLRFFLCVFFFLAWPRQGLRMNGCFSLKVLLVPLDALPEKFTLFRRFILILYVFGVVVSPSGSSLLSQKLVQ